MKKELLHKSLLSLILLSCLLTSASFAQGTYGASRYFNFQYDSLSAAEKTAFTGGATVKTSVDGDSLIFGSANSQSSSRTSTPYVGSIKCKSILLPQYASLGYFSFYAQNGSTGTTRNLYVKISTNNGSTWITADTFIVTSNSGLRYTVSSALSKKGVRVMIDSDGQYFWFYQMEAWSSTLASTDPLEAPKILSITPAGGSTIPSTGSIDIQFDELVKTGTGSVVFGAGTVIPAYKGSILRVNYGGLTGSSNTLTVPGSFVKNNGSITMVKDTSIVYIGDIADPVYQSVSPVDGSNINVSSVTGNIVLTFNEPILRGTGTISFDGPFATITDTAIGNTLVIKYTGLAYSTNYILTIPANTVKDVSGNTYKTDITINYITNAKDNTPPTLSAQSITNGATSIPIGGSIALTFNEIVQKGTGNITINGVPATLSFNGTMAGINYTNLDYNVSNTVVIPSGAITDTTGNAYAGTTFNFTTKAFSLKAFDIIIAKDGSGNYSTIQAAINAVPDNSSQRTFVYVKNGIYNEKVLIPASKQNLSLIGQDSAKTILTFNDFAGAPGGSTDLSYTIDIKAQGFYAENIKIKNTYGQGSQAVALMTEGDQQVFKNCSATGFQDTHYPKQPNTRSYYLNCFIEGATDFMFGSGTVFFEECKINCISGGQYTTAPSGSTREFGLVYNNCSITSNSNVLAQSFFLGRPWKDFAKTVWINTKMGPHIKDVGWAVWTTSGADADNHLTGYFGEYNSMTLAGAPINLTPRASWDVRLTTPQAARYTIDNVFNYGVGLSTWNPLPYSTAPAAPSNLVVSSNVLNWTAPAYAVGFVVFRNDSVVGTTVNTNFTDATASGNSNTYIVKAVNEYGAQSASSNQIVTSIDKNYNAYINIFEIYPNPFTDVITIKNSEKLKTLEFFNAEGQMVKQTEAASSIRTSNLKSGFYMVKVITKNDETYYVKMIKP
jgi:pectin methylesterase-like acyl-CoA thioesterase